MGAYINGNTLGISSNLYGKHHEDWGVPRASPISEDISIDPPSGNDNIFSMLF